MKIKQLLLSFAFLVCAVTLSAQDEFTLVKVGDIAPDFAFSTENGETKKLSELKGKVVWINFFATWCGPCRQELPHLQKDVYNKLKSNKNFELIILGREHSWAEINKFKTDNNYNMPFYPDTGRKVFSLYAKQNIPRNFIIDKNGNIAMATIGFTQDEFEKMKQKVAGLIE